MKASAQGSTSIDNATLERDFQTYIRALEAESGDLRKRLEDLRNALYEAREQITALKDEVEKLCAPPSTYGVFLAPLPDGTINVLSQGRKLKVNLHPSIDVQTLRPGQELVLNEGLNVIEAARYEIQGDVVVLKERLNEERAVVALRSGRSS
jgi:proteasome-associated ATPase